MFFTSPKFSSRALVECVNWPWVNSLRAEWMHHLRRAARVLTRADFEPLKTVGKGQWGKVFLVRKSSGPVAGRAAADPGLVFSGGADNNVSGQKREGQAAERLECITFSLQRNFHSCNTANSRSGQKKQCTCLWNEGVGNYCGRLCLVYGSRNLDNGFQTMKCHAKIYLLSCNARHSSQRHNSITTAIPHTRCSQADPRFYYTF